MVFLYAWEQREFGSLVTRVSQTSNNLLFPRVEYEDINAGQGSLNKNVYLKNNTKAGIKFEIGDILYGKLRPYLKNWMLSSFSGIAVGDWWVLRKINDNELFIYYLIQSSRFQRYSNLSIGTKMPRADWRIVSNTKYFIPNIIEQQKIGHFFQQLDDTITLHQCGPNNIIRRD